MFLWRHAEAGNSDRLSQAPPRPSFRKRLMFSCSSVVSQLLTFPSYLQLINWGQGPLGEASGNGQQNLGIRTQPFHPMQDSSSRPSLPYSSLLGWWRLFSYLFPGLTAPNFYLRKSDIYIYIYIYPYQNKQIKQEKLHIIKHLLLLLLSRFSRVRLCVTPYTAAHQAPPSPGLSGQEHWSGLPFPSPIRESEKWKWSRSVMSDSSLPHGLQPTRLLHPWDFPGKSTGVGCHCLLQIKHLESSNYYSFWLKCSPTLFWSHFLKTPWEKMGKICSLKTVL